MDRFIVSTENTNFTSWGNLKSNMDRFIAQCTISRHLQKGNLKSNMDRFIENVGGNSSTVNNI